MAKKSNLKVVEQPKLWKLDLGCGKNKKEGFIGVDARQFDGKVDVVFDLNKVRKGVPEWKTLLAPKSDGNDIYEKWPWDDCSVEEAHCSHFLEHLTRIGRVFFMNEMYRILIPGGKCQIITPHWASNRAYGDMTHEMPPVAEMFEYYLDKNWRETNAPHNDFYKCDFACAWGYNLHPQISVRNQEYQQHAMTFFKEAAQDMICTMTKRV